MNSIDIKAKQKDFHNYYIDIFRFLLIFWIVLFHYTVQYNTLGLDKTFGFPFHFEKGGTVGVSLFFMVSGFFMTKSLLSDKSGYREYGRYIVKRYLRLWIPYAFACIIIYLWLLFLPVEGRVVDFTTLLANIACIIHPGFERVDNAHWFLADLLTIQLLLGLVVFVKRVNYKKYLASCLFVIAIVAQVISLPILAGFSKQLFEVLLGIHICMMVKDKNLITTILTVAGLIIVLYLSIYSFIGVCVFGVLIFCGKRFPLPSSSHNLKIVLQFAGTLSFYWYLIHQNIGYSIMYHFLPNDNNLLWLLIPMVATLCVSLLVYLIDNLLNKFVIKRLLFSLQ